MKNLKFAEALNSEVENIVENTKVFTTNYSSIFYKQ